MLIMFKQFILETSIDAFLYLLLSGPTRHHRKQLRPWPSAASTESSDAFTAFTYISANRVCHITLKRCHPFVAIGIIWCQCFFVPHFTCQLYKFAIVFRSRFPNGCVDNSIHFLITTIRLISFLSTRRCRYFGVHASSWWSNNGGIWWNRYKLMRLYNAHATSKKSKHLIKAMSSKTSKSKTA